MKKFLSILLVGAMMLSLGCVLASCAPHEHTWSTATCQDPGRCVECGEIGTTTAAHAYHYGKCTVCGEISDAAMDDLTSTVKSLYGIYWVLNYSDEVSLTHVDDMTVNFSTTSITGDKGQVSGNIIVKAEDGKYYTDDFSLHLVNKDDDWVRDTDYDMEFNTQPIECYETGAISNYYFTKNPTYTYNTYSGQSRSTINFGTETCTVKIYDYYGFLDSSSTFDYTIQHGVLWEIVILEGASSNIELVKMDNGLIWDDMVFLLNN